MASRASDAALAFSSSASFFCKASCQPGCPCPRLNLSAAAVASASSWSGLLCQLSAWRSRPAAPSIAFRAPEPLLQLGWTAAMAKSEPTRNIPKSLLVVSRYPPVSEAVTLPHLDVHDSVRAATTRILKKHARLPAVLCAGRESASLRAREGKSGWRSARGFGCLRAFRLVGWCSPPCRPTLRGAPRPSSARHHLLHRARHGPRDSAGTSGLPRVLMSPILVSAA